MLFYKRMNAKQCAAAFYQDNAGLLVTEHIGIIRTHNATHRLTSNHLRCHDNSTRRLVSADVATLATRRRRLGVSILIIRRRLARRGKKQAGLDASVV